MVASKTFVQRQKSLVGVLAVIAVFAVLYIWDARQLAPMFSNVGTGALMAAIGLGVVLTFRGSGVVNFANGVITVFVAYWYYGLKMEGKFYIPPLPNPLVLVEIPVVRRLGGGLVDRVVEVRFVDIAGHVGHGAESASVAVA